MTVNLSEESISKVTPKDEIPSPELHSIEFTENKVQN